MNLIVDSSVWIDGFSPKAKTPEKELLVQLIRKDYPIYLCPIIYQEVLQGIRDDKVFEQIKYILQQFVMINMDLLRVTNHAVDLYRSLRKKGITIRKPVDCLIASYAILADMYLLHKDDDFTKISKGCNLKIYNVNS